MRRFVLFAPVLAAGLVVGCEGSPPPAESGVAPATPAAFDVTSVSQRYAAPTAARPSTRPAPSPLAGVWVGSGWMGDLETLSYRAVQGNPPADEWTYRPDRGTLGWAAVGLQWPDSNFGAVPGKNLVGKGYDRLSFQVRSVGDGPVRVLFKSGGHTIPGARYPASYEVEIDPVALDSTWRDVSLSLSGRDLSNIPVALVVVFTPQTCPGGAVIQLRGAAFR